MKNFSLGMSSSPFQKTFEKKNIFLRYFLLFSCILLLTTPVSCITGGLDKIPIGECFLLEKLIEYVSHLSQYDDLANSFPHAKRKFCIDNVSQGIDISRVSGRQRLM